MAHAQLLISYGQAFVAPERRQHRSSMSVRLPEAPLLKVKGGCAVILEVIRSLAEDGGRHQDVGCQEDGCGCRRRWEG